MHPARLTRRAVLLSLCFLLLSAMALAVKGSYLPAGRVDLLAVLAPAPAQGSAVAREDMAELLALQKTRTRDQELAAQADSARTPYRFADVLGPAFAPPALPLTDALLTASAKDASLAVARVKKHWNRPRPFMASQEVEPCLTRPASASYPSGHATFGHIMAILLAAMVPEKAAELYARGEEYARQRVIGGVHFPSDIEAGRIAAAVVASNLFQDKAFMEDFARARAELRAVLKLPETPAAQVVPGLGAPEPVEAAPR